MVLCFFPSLTYCEKDVSDNRDSFGQYNHNRGSVLKNILNGTKL